ncbi:MAG: AmmeMemoRadiSam system protein B [Acidobacteria bacterium]|nr:MAG: AmmeMemoRadiSam system protein B [Acidobacteriota bacterium]
MLRKAAVAGRFYPANNQVLRSDLAGYLGVPQSKIKARGIVVPHAGYMYSGHVAGAVYARIELPGRMIILCPNHTGLGAPRASGKFLWGRWQLTPSSPRN